MKIQIGNVEREVMVEMQDNGVARCKVGKALVYWGKGYAEPFIMIRGKSYEEVKPHRAMIIKFLREYKRRVSIPSNPAPISYVNGEEPSHVGSDGISNAYTNVNDDDDDYVSSVPKWLTELKEWQLCSGPKQTYMRRVRLPEEHRNQAELYMPYCSMCKYRPDCQSPCLNPELYSQEDILIGL